MKILLEPRSLLVLQGSVNKNLGPPQKKTGLPSWPEKKHHRISLPVVDSGIFIPVFCSFLKVD